MFSKSKSDLGNPVSQMRTPESSKQFGIRITNIHLILLVLAFLVLGFDDYRSRLGTIAHWLICLSFLLLRPNDLQTEFPRPLSIAVNSATAATALILAVQVYLYFFAR